MTLLPLVGDAKRWGPTTHRQNIWKREHVSYPSIFNRRSQNAVGDVHDSYNQHKKSTIVRLTYDRLSTQTPLKVIQGNDHSLLYTLNCLGDSTLQGLFNVGMFKGESTLQ